jgi:hypothetical protein
LAIIDPARRARIRTIPLPAHPEGIQIDEVGRRAIVNLPDAGSIAIADLAGGRVSAIWATSHRANFPMSLIQSSRTIAIGYRSPSRLVLLDGSSGAVRQDLPTCEDSDDLFFDDKRHRIYVSCGAGQIDVFEQIRSGYVLAGHLATRPGARTSLFVPARDRLYLAAPADSQSSDAALFVYRPEP